MNTNLKTTLTSLLVFSLLATFTVLAVGAESDSHTVSATIVGSRSLETSAKKEGSAPETAGGAGSLTSSFQFSLSFETDYRQEVITVRAYGNGISQFGSESLEVTGGDLRAFELTEESTGEAKILWSNKPGFTGSIEIGDVLFSPSGDGSEVGSLGEGKEYRVVYTVESA